MKKRYSEEQIIKAIKLAQKWMTFAGIWTFHPSPFTTGIIKVNVWLAGVCRCLSVSILFKD